MAASYSIDSYNIQEVTISVSGLTSGQKIQWVVRLDADYDAYVASESSVASASTQTKTFSGLGSGTRYAVNIAVDGVWLGKKTFTTQSGVCMTKARINSAGLDEDGNVTYYAKTSTDKLRVSWTWNDGTSRCEHTSEYEFRLWYRYKLSSGKLALAPVQESTISTPKGSPAQYTDFDIPSGAVELWVHVRPVSTTYEVTTTVNKKTTTTTQSYFEAEWSDMVTKYQVPEAAIEVPEVDAPGTPTVEIQNGYLTATVKDVENLNADVIVFQFVRDGEAVDGEYETKIRYGIASYKKKIKDSTEYKVRAKAVRSSDGAESEWSSYSDDYSTPPDTPYLGTYRAQTETSVYLEWDKISLASSYEIEYTPYHASQYVVGFETNTITGITTNYYTITGLTTGQWYAFRVRAVNDSGNSEWSAWQSELLGAAPAAPTTWSNSTTIIVGEMLKLYWVHNSEDNSLETFARLELIIGGEETTITIPKETIEGTDEKTTTSVYEIDTSQYAEGTKIQWRVQTRGIYDDYGPWSTQRVVDIYAEPSLSITVIDKLSGDSVSSIRRYPFVVEGSAGPVTQTPIEYHISLFAETSYDDLDFMGNPVVVNEGDELFSSHFLPASDGSCSYEFGPSDVDLQAGQQYRIVCAVVMDSGLTAEDETYIWARFAETDYYPNADVIVDKETFSVTLAPYCHDVFGELTDDCLLSIYRRDYDGQFTEIATGLTGKHNVAVTDPHPALDKARYRVVAITKSSGHVSYRDLPGVKIGGKGIVMQWDENWSAFDYTEGDNYTTPTYSGSMVVLKGNVDTSSSYKPDVELAEYAGRQAPVAYYGTHRGETATWNAEFDRRDKDMLYALRRLARWMGNVYVREPSGAGYWAQVTVSFSETHCEVTIPVQFSITRVEGGK